MHYDVLITGAGLYGCTMARELADYGMRVLVIDKRPHVGGNAYTRNVRGIQVHEYGAHIFHTDDREVWAFVSRFARFNRYVNSPLAVFGDELYNLPFNMNTFSRMWNIRTPEEAREIISAQAHEAVRHILAKRAGVTPDAVTDEEIAAFEPGNLEEQGLALAGYDVFDKLIRGYTEKQWGRTCRDLPAFIIRRVPLRFTYDNNYFDSTYQGIPVGGYTRMCERMLGTGTFREEEEDAPDPGKPKREITVRLNTAFDKLIALENGLPVDTVTAEAKAAFAKSDYTPVKYATVEGDTVGHIVYTGQIDAFFDYRFGALEYRSLRFEEEDLPDVDNYQGNAVVNYTSADVPYTRIVEHKHFEFGKGAGTVITREYPDVFDEGKEPYYPVNDEKNNALYARYLELAETLPNVMFGGRLGRYRYYDMDQVVRAALDDVSTIIVK